MTGLAVVEYTDPMCPWAWGSEPTFRYLRAALAVTGWRRVFGILFDLDDDPPPDPAAETAWYHRHLQDISGHTGAPWPAVLARVALSSWPSSLAARAAQEQGDAVADRVLRRLRETVFVLGEPADTPERALAAVCGVPGLDVERLAAAMAAPGTGRAARRDHREARRPDPEVVGLRGPGPHPGAAKPAGEGVRYGFPTLVFTGPAGRAIVPGWRPLDHYLDAAERVAPGSVDHAPKLGDLALHRSLTGPEVRLLLGVTAPPAGAVEVPTAGGPVFLDQDEAASHPATKAR
ncbi:DsbA family oxidoreductase [Dactylosporangium sp. CA-092794]|uniref:DsbA family oxidoreductase n=1 Tax=Dactylosporangium sp. CA-092794 TaxID=3239929 RepID=UPI003D89CB16